MDSSRSPRSPDIRLFIDRLGGVLTDPQAWGLVGVGVAFLAAMFRNGFGLFPAPSIHQHIFLARDFPAAAPLPPDATYLYNSMVGAGLAHYLGIRSVSSWAIFSMLVFVVALVALVILTLVAGGRSAAGPMMVAFAGAGVSTVLFGWLGGYDVFTFLGLTIIALSSRWWLSLAGGLLVGMNAVEVGIFAIIALVVAGWADNRVARIPAAGAILGLGVGFALIKLWQHSAGVTGSRASFIAEYGVGRLIEESAGALPVVALTWLGASIVIFAWAGYAQVLTRWRLAVATVVAVAPAMIVIDQTRIGALTVWPLLAWLVIRIHRADRVASGRLSAVVLLLACIYPAVVVWRGQAELMTWWAQ